MMTATYFFLIQLLTHTSANPGFSTGGVTFSVAIPATKYVRKAGSISLITDWFPASVAVYSSNPSDINPKWVARNYELDKHTSASHPISGYEALYKNGVYRIIRIHSRTPIRVVVLIIDSMGLVTESYTAMPETSCFRSYYVTTSLGYPSLMVMSFTSITHFRVRFPQYNNPFNVKCNAKGNCISGNEVTVKLQPYMVWYFHLNDPKLQFHDTVIESDAPIFVVSGSNRCVLDKTSKDRCLSNMMPSVSWGKEYVIPEINVGSKTDIPAYMRMNAKKYPLEVKTHDTVPNYDTVVMKDHQGLYQIKLSYPAIVYASVPFGLYLFTSNAADAVLASLIPVEQWMHGLFYVNNEMDKVLTKNSYFFIMDTNAKNIIYTYNNESRKLPTSFLNGTKQTKSYRFTYVDMRTESSKLWMRDPNNKLMLYLRGTTKESANILLPYEYYQGSIYHPNCNKFEPVIDDGIDNDCDGFIDEEFLNSKDDDGDGGVDEDTADKIRDGAWGEWKNICRIECEGLRVWKKIRACNNPIPSRLGNDCKGSNMACEPKSTKCSEICGNNTTSPKQICECNEGCKDCTRTKVCTVCKENYSPGDFCQTPCPSNSTGVGCVNKPRDQLDSYLESKDYHFDNPADEVNYRDYYYNGFPDEKYGKGESKGKYKIDKDKETTIATLFGIFLFLLMIAAALMVYKKCHGKETKAKPLTQKGTITDEPFKEKEMSLKENTLKEEVPEARGEGEEEQTEH